MLNVNDFNENEKQLNWWHKQLIIISFIIFFLHSHNNNKQKRMNCLMERIWSISNIHMFTWCIGRSKVFHSRILERWINILTTKNTINQFPVTNKSRRADDARFLLCEWSNEIKRNKENHHFQIYPWRSDTEDLFTVQCNDQFLFLWQN